MSETLQNEESSASGQVDSENNNPEEYSYS